MHTVSVFEPGFESLGWKVVAFDLESYPDKGDLIATSLYPASIKIAPDELVQRYNELLCDWWPDDECGGTVISSWSDTKLGDILTYLDEDCAVGQTRFVTLLRRASKRVYKPSIFAEPPPIP